ncbi:YcaO-like family protein [Jannaschia sp. CCS1]|uniref:YcaO-like family protein n=1 Tax=Jannaschia sp. (strain CCS1) TaxID=290400 RepID=UPI000053A5A6|nr:YcaO-like family protein [Jannaschia sp. CCS1]ABD55178.1 protein of unknown function DUF181 [Jannaschia sp. CCS1]
MTAPRASDAGSPGSIARKTWAHRTCQPEFTYRRLRRVAERVGITRVADITDLDRVGLPVFQAVRPMGRSLSVSQGKGMTSMAARVSAMMEAVEIWHAEQDLPTTLRATIRSLGTRRAMDPNQLLMPGRDKVCEDLPIVWCPSLNLLDGADVLVPRDAANLDFTRAPDPPMLARSTTGLAGGNTRDEARASAIAEVIERACQREFQRLPPASRAQRRLDPTCLASAHRGLADPIERIRSAGLHLDIFDMTNRFDVPAIRAVIYETTAGKPVAWPCLGHGAHLDPVTAVVRALTEAAQARLTGISGNRDDISPGHYAGADMSNWVLRAMNGMDMSGTRRGLRHHDASGDSPAADVAAMIARITAHDADPLLEVDLSRPEIGVPVVKIIAPRIAYLASR